MRGRDHLPRSSRCAKGATCLLTFQGDSLVYRALTASLLSLAMLGTAACDPRWDQGEKDLQEPLGSPSVCQDKMSDPDVLRARRLADSSLRKALREGRGDPAEEAAHAVERGDFRLAGAVTESGVSTALYGAECRMQGDLPSRTVRVIAFVEDDGAEKAPPQEQFGRAYNAALLENPAYPYADVCRPTESVTPEDDAGSEKGPLANRPFGFMELEPLRTSPTLAEVARRGAVGRLERMIRTGDYDVNEPDLFGMTPLAWAIAYRRRGASDVLLREGSSPGGSRCQTIFDRYSPMQVARAQQWIGMLRRMQPLVSEDEFNSLQELPRIAAGDIDRFNMGLAELNESFEDEFRGNRWITRHRVYFTVDEEGEATGCRVEPSTTYEDYDVQICDLGLRVLHWKPARGVFGNVISGESSLIVGVKTR